MKRLVALLVTIPLFLHAQSSQKSLSVQLIYGSSTFAGKSLGPIRWIDDGKKFSYQQFDTSSKSNNIWSYRLSDGKQELLVDLSKLHQDTGSAPFRYTTYQWSPDERHVLFVSAPPERQYLSRLSPAGNLYLYDLRSRELRRLTNVSVPQYNQKFSPDGKKIGLVRDNNIFVIDVESGAEMQLTTDGAEHIINGKFDWVYEEEFGISDGWQWSPDGKSIAFWRLDENRIPTFNLMDFMTIRADVRQMRYPKAGDPNSTVKIGVVNMDSRTTVWMDVGTNDDMYLPRMEWSTDPGTLVIQRLNRAQNRLDVLTANASTGATQPYVTEEEKTWVDMRHDYRWLKSNGHMMWISERDGFAHIYDVGGQGKTARQVTKGKWEVDELMGVDEDNKTVYFVATQKTPLERQFYSVKLDGSSMRQLTRDGFSHSIQLSPDRKYFLDTYSNAVTPPKCALYTIEGKLVRMVEENPLAVLSEYSMGTHQFFTFKTTDGVELNGWMIKPIGFDAQKKYPVLLYVYGGPGSQTVTNSWGGSNSLWYHLLSEKGYILASVDGRGTGQRGKEFKSVTYKNLGKWEVNDQIEVAKYFGSLPYVDKTRIGIWGWSYGGYMSALTILKGSDYFKTAVAVAPVTDWRFYDNIYTERYMLRPADNPEGYKESSPIRYADRLKGNLLIVHGTTDDNVHWQNTVQLVDALEKAGKQFTTMYYVNKNHGIYGGNTRVHLFDLITNFILEKL